MENNKDIANQVKNVLEDGIKSPENSLWDKVNKTLDEKASRRKRIFYWRMAIGIFIPLLLLFIYLQVDGKQNAETQNINSQTISSEVNTDSTELNKNISHSDSLLNVDQNSVQKSTTEIEEKNHNSILVEKKKHNEKSSKYNSKNSKNSEHDSMEGFKVKSTYYYFNSETNKHLQTNDKTVIDSLIKSSKEEVKDSI